MSKQTIPAAVASATRSTWAGTSDLVESIIEERRGLFAWRPAYAGALYAAAQDERVWMTPEEFSDWVTTAKVVAKRRENGLHPRDVLGISQAQLRSWSSKSAVPKTVALACAHYLHGRSLPCAPTARDFDAWFTPRFGAVNRIATWLGIGQNTLSCRLRGFEVKDDVRVEREPEPYLLRALDWVWSVGPICPYGERPPVALWNEQEI